MGIKTDWFQKCLGIDSFKLLSLLRLFLRELPSSGVSMAQGTTGFGATGFGGKISAAGAKREAAEVEIHQRNEGGPLNNEHPMLVAKPPSPL